MRKKEEEEGTLLSSSTFELLLPLPLLATTAENRARLLEGQVMATTAAVGRSSGLSRRIRAVSASALSAGEGQVRGGGGADFLFFLFLLFFSFLLSSPSSPELSSSFFPSSSTSPAARARPTAAALAASWASRPAAVEEQEDGGGTAEEGEGGEEPSGGGGLPPPLPLPLRTSHHAPGGRSTTATSSPSRARFCAVAPRTMASTGRPGIAR